MPDQIEKANELSAKKEDFSNWYAQINFTAGILDRRYKVKGMYVWMPYGFSMMRAIKEFWDKLFQEDEIEEMYFPLLVPMEYTEQNESWWDGFKDEAFWVKGYNEEKPTHILRPTGEPAMYPMFSKWIRTSTDLPLRIYQTTSSFRFETKHTRPMIRDREITVWHEIHTVHATEKENNVEEAKHEEFYDKIWDYLSLPSIKAKKPQWEVFPGAVGAIEYYALMPSGKVIENGSINNLGQAYAKKFNIKFKDDKGHENYGWQMSTGVGARLLATVIGLHGDDRGLVIPPTIAPIQAVIIPIFSKKEKNKVMKVCERVFEELKSNGIKVKLDSREESPGSKFYDWELKGVPVRLEIGPRDLEKDQATVVRRDNREKQFVKLESLSKKLPKLFEEIKISMYEKAKKHLDEHRKGATTKSDLMKYLKKGYVVSVGWCGESECYDEISELEEGTELFGSDLNSKKGTCVICEKATTEVGLVANSY